MEQSLLKFWKNISDSNAQISNGKKLFEIHFEETHYRTFDSQYVVSMPMEDATFLEESEI